MSADLWPSNSASANKFAREVWVGVALYLVAMAIGVLMSWRLHLPQWGAILMGSATIGYALSMLRALLRMLSSLDEMQRRMQHEALLITAAVVGFGSFAYSMFEVTGVVPTMPHALFFVLPVMILIWRVAFLFVVRRYQ